MVMPVLRLLLIYCVIALVVVGIFKRDTLSPFVFGEPEAVAVVEAAEEETETAADSEPEEAPVPRADETPAAEVPEAPAQDVAVAEPAAEPVAEPAAVAESNAHDGSLQMPVAEAAPEPQPEPQHAPEPAPEPKFVEAPLAAPTPAATPDAEPAAPQGATGTLADARNAYWAGNFEKAGAILTALAEASPEDAAVLGELGNFQYAQRQFTAAASTYLRAGELLIEQGRGAQAQGLVPVLQQLDPQKAGALVQALQAQQLSNGG